MTFKQMIRNLSRNASFFAETGEMEKATACLALISFIQENEYDKIKGHVDMTPESV
jgi:hypothetical protein